MPILSNFPSGGGDTSDYATITFYDWDLTPLGSIVVPKGEDVTGRVKAFENTLKATTFDEGSQYYNSDKSKPLTNKKGYSFEGVWLDYNDPTFTHYGNCTSVTSTSTVETIPQPDGVSFAKVDKNLSVKAAYGNNDEINIANGTGMRYTIEILGYGRHGTANTYKIDLRIKRENANGQGVPRLRQAGLRLTYYTEDETPKQTYYPLYLKNVDEQTITIHVSHFFGRVSTGVVDLYGVYNAISGAGGRSATISAYKGTPEEKDGFVFLGTMRGVNDYIASNGAYGTAIQAASMNSLGLNITNPETGKNFGTAILKNNLTSAWRSKNPDWESGNHPLFEDLTWDEMQYAIQNEGELMPEIQSLAETSWEQIAKISNSGLAPTYWAVGDEKDIVVNGETLTIVIMDFNHDVITGGTRKAGITFGLKNLMATTHRMEETDTNTNGFTGSEMYTWLQGELLSSLPEDLQSVLKLVDKKTSAGNQSTTINTDSMKIFLFSEVEVSGTVSHAVEGEGTQYLYFATTANRIKYLANGTGSVHYWWERSPYVYDSSKFCTVHSGGSIPSASSSDIAHGVCFGFCI